MYLYKFVGLTSCNSRPNMQTAVVGARTLPLQLHPGHDPPPSCHISNELNKFCNGKSWAQQWATDPLNTKQQEDGQQWMRRFSKYESNWYGMSPKLDGLLTFSG